MFKRSETMEIVKAARRSTVLADDTDSPSDPRGPPPSERKLAPTQHRGYPTLPGPPGSHPGQQGDIPRQQLTQPQPKQPKQPKKAPSKKEAQRNDAPPQTSPTWTPWPASSDSWSCASVCIIS